MAISVLIIDDSYLDRIIAETAIRKDRFAEHMVSCGSANEGIGYLESMTGAPEKLPDVIILDVNMPVRDGFDFLDDFLKLPDNIQKHCYIYMISATNSPEDFERIAKYTIVRKFFQKPLSPEILNDIRTDILPGALPK